MKKRIFVLFLMLMCTSLPLFSYQIMDYNFNSKELGAFNYQNDKFLVLGLDTMISWTISYTTPYLYSNGNWTQLPNKLMVNNSEERINANKNSSISPDGSIWLLGYTNLYHYINGEWKKHTINDPNTSYKREFVTMVVDDLGVPWVFAQVSNSNWTISKSEVYRFQNDTFELFYQTPSVLSFASLGRYSRYSPSYLPGGTLVFTKLVDANEDPAHNIVKDLIFADKDLNIDEYQMPYIRPYDTSFKAVSCIYAESKEKVWFGIDQYEYLDVNKNKHYSYSGLLLKDGSNWKIFDNKDGLPILFQDTCFTPILKMKKWGDTYVLVGNNDLFYMKSDLKIKKISWNNAIADIKFYKANSNVQDSTINSLVINLLDSNKLQFRVDLTDNGKIMLTSNKCLGIADINAILDVEENPEKALGVFPNPAKSAISLKNLEYDTDIEIYNLNGELVKHGIYNGVSIDINELSVGSYLIKTIKNNNINYFNFVKE